jgi:hypothetical protein
MRKEIRIVQEGVGVWVVYKGQEWIIKFYDEKGKKQAQWFVQDYFGIKEVA